ncbi:MAG: DUF2920 family protein [Phycisphaeraceae bacterium]|nr:DUF2920 family protein [Phycisphaeraceae bacterium]
MAQHQTYEVAGAEDIELCTRRAGLLSYTLAMPDGLAQGAPAAGLVLFIPGFGEDNDGGYAEGLCGWIADTFGLACATVAYHAQGCRISTGATRAFKQPDADRLVGYCQQYGVPVGEGASPGDLMQQLQQSYASAVEAGRAGGTLTLTCGLVPRGGEAQNFGLMQAIDHLKVLQDLRTRVAYDRRNVIAMGSSHGGYLAQLMGKLAPNTLRAVFDNSGYVTAPPRYVNGREANLPDYIERFSPVMQMYFFLDSMWSFDERASNYYHADAQAIRSLIEPKHLQTMAQAGTRPVRYRCVHGPGDEIAPTEAKEAYCQRLQELGFDVQFRCMGPEDVDGQYVKSLEHGMGLSLRGFFQRSYASLPDSDLAGSAPDWLGDDFDRQTRLAYAGPDRVYTFAFTETGLAAALEQGPKPQHRTA